MGWKAITDTFHADVDEITVHDERRERQLRVRGFVRSVSNPTRTYVNALSTWWMGKGYVDSKLPHTEGGHLIALELGGADSQYNLVPMYGNVNRGAYRGIERDLGTWVSTTYRPALLVELGYTDTGVGDTRIPTAMHIYRYANVTDLSAVVARSDALYRTVPNTPESPVRFAITGEDIHLREALIKIKTAFRPDLWWIEKVYPEASRFIPALNERPNAWLDYLIYSDEHIKVARQLLSKVAEGLFTIGGGQKFFDPQRAFLALAVALTEPSDEKKGECWSQDPADPIKTALTSLGTDDGIHVDHIYPKGKSGWNVYSNAALISSLLNKSKGGSLD